MYRLVVIRDMETRLNVSNKQRLEFDRWYGTRTESIKIKGTPGVETVVEIQFDVREHPAVSLGPPGI